MNYSDCFISIAEEEIQYISLYGSHLLTFIRVWVEAKHSHLITPPRLQDLYNVYDEYYD